MRTRLVIFIYDKKTKANEIGHIPKRIANNIIDIHKRNFNIFKGGDIEYFKTPDPRQDLNIWLATLPMTENYKDEIKELIKSSGLKSKRELITIHNKKKENFVSAKRGKEEGEEDEGSLTIKIGIGERDNKEKISLHDKETIRELTKRLSTILFIKEFDIDREIETL